MKSTDFNRVQIRVTDDIYLSIIQGEGTYSTKHETVEIAVINTKTGTVSDPEAEIDGHALANYILDIYHEGENA